MKVYYICIIKICPVCSGSSSSLWQPPCGGPKRLPYCAEAGKTVGKKAGKKKKAKEKK